MRLLLVRHGESICAVNGIVGGEIGCTGLTDRGLDQARALRERFVAERFNPDVVLASPLPRALQTAETVADGLGLPTDVRAELCEFVPGEIDGTKWEDYAGFDVVAEPDRVISPGGESLNVFKARVSRLIDGLADEFPEQTVVAVCHGGVIYRSVYHGFNMADGSMLGDVDFTSITEWRRENDRWHLVRFNDVAHLMSAGLLVS